MFLINSRKVFPGFGISLGSSMLFICLILILPISVLFMQLSKITLNQYWEIITHPQVIAAYKITLISAFISTLFNIIFGILIAWILTKYKFPGKSLIDTLVDIPFALPTAVAGLILAKLFSINGLYGSFLANFNIQISYTWVGIAIAMAFTSLPFIIRSLQPVLEILGHEYEEAAQTLGANKWQVFRHITLPEILPALFTGASLSFTRSLGEFGAIVFITSNIAWKTEVISLIIFVRVQEFNYAAASAISSVILFFSLLLLLLINILQNRYIYRLGKI